jgi:urease accessory protein UreF
MTDLAQRLRDAAVGLEGYVNAGLLREAADVLDSFKVRLEHALASEQRATKLWQELEAERDEFKRLHDVAFQDASAMEARLAAAERVVEAARDHNKTASASSLDKLDGELRRYDAQWVGVDEVS